MSYEKSNLYEQFLQRWGDEQTAKVLIDIQRRVSQNDRNCVLTIDQILEIWKLVPEVFPLNWELPQAVSQITPDPKGLSRYSLKQKSELVRIMRLGGYPCTGQHVEEVIRLGIVRLSQPGTNGPNA